MSDLNMLLDEREIIMLCGGHGSGKTWAVVKLIEQGEKEGFNVLVIDRDRGMTKAVKEIFGKNLPESLVEYYVCTTWSKVEAGMNDAFKLLTPGDWLVFEHAGRLWDLAQTTYSEIVYGEDLTEHLLALRADAQQAIEAAGAGLRSKDKEKRSRANKEVAQSMAYSGMEGRTDWSVIKRMHNNNVFDRAVLEGNFNILTTTALTPLMDEDISKHRWPEFHKLGQRPEGEKHNVYRHDSIVIAENKGKTRTWRTDLGAGIGKDRGRKLFRDIDFMDKGFVKSYLETVNG